MVRWFIDRSPQRNSPSVSLRRILPEATFVGGRDLQVSSYSTDPSTIQPGQVFVAVQGEAHDGHALVRQAVELGAAGVMVERPCPEMGKPQVVVPNMKTAYARLNHAMAGDPAERLDVIGIAGGNQARLITRLLRSILEVAQERFGHVGPEGWSDGLATRPIESGASESAGLATMLAAMVRRKCVGGLVEISLGTLETSGMADGMEFDTAIVTSVQGTSESDLDVRTARRRAFARLVRRVRTNGIVVVDEDDPDSEILGSVNLAAERISIGINRQADVSAEVDWFESNGARFLLKTDDHETPITLRIGGIDAIRAALAATAVARSRGIDMATIVTGLEAVDNLPGHFDCVDEGQAFEVRIDPARSSYELATALRQAKEGRSGKVLCVIGAEGHGDLEERAKIGGQAERGADIVIFTSDNPRGEDPLNILKELHAGANWAEHIFIDPDRRQAIETALSMAAPGDVVVIAGKGRNGFQILDHHVIPFDDRAVAASCLRAAKMTAASHISA